MCNDAMNVSCDSNMNDLLDDNNLFIFDDESVKISLVSKMSFRKEPRDSMNVCSKSNSNKYLPITVHKWLPKLQPLAEPVAKWFPIIVQICLWIIDSGCSKHMTGNRALLTNFMQKFLGTVHFGNNDFAVIAGYGDVVIAKASSSQSWLWHQRLSHLNFATINNLVKNNLVQGLTKRKFEKDHFCSACEQGKFHRKYHKSKTAFASNKPLYLLYMDLCGPMRIQSINGKRFMLVVIDDYSRYTWVFFLHSKDEASEVIISFIKKTQVDLQLQVQCVRTDNGKSSNQLVSQVSKASKKDLEDLFQDFYDEYFDSSKIMKSSTTNVKTSINEEVFHKVSESFQGESSSSSLNDDVQQSPKEVILP
nr:retrovirus-related Pol polyprotein from transposon TNT 1-94 [Tanacetum cinerariifolium]